VESKGGLRLPGVGFRTSLPTTAQSDSLRKALDGVLCFHYQVDASTMNKRIEQREAISMSGTYADLQVWQAAMDLAEDIYRITKTFPREETYGLSIQLRRAAVSVPSNIAEGKVDLPTRNSHSFSVTHEDPCLKSRPRSISPAVWATWTRDKLKLFSSRLSASASFSMAYSERSVPHRPRRI
jgi:23S rRNA-intervening sequence protein